MGFHEIQLPTNLSYGSRFGPGFSTSIIELDSGGSERIARWPNARRRYNLKYAIKKLDDLTAVYDFYLARGGPLNGFRIKDFFDFASSSNHRNPQAFSDQQLGTGNGAQTAFQLIKTYTSGSQSVVRAIRKPVAGTITIGNNGSSTAAFTLDTTTGIVTFNTAPANGNPLTWGGQYDVPVQFDGDMDEAFSVAYEGFEGGSLPDMLCTEVVQDVSTPDKFNYGDGEAVSFTGTYRLGATSKRTQVLTPNASADVLLPDATDLDNGFPYFVIRNAAGAATLTFKKFDGSTTYFTMTAGKTAIVFLYPVSGVKTWGAAVS